MWRRALAWLVVVIVALAIGLWSFAVCNELRAPNKSLAVPLPYYTSAGGNLALLSYGARLAKDPRTKVTAVERSLASQAYRNEPLSVTALGLLAVSMTDSNEQSTRRYLLEQAGKLSRRSTMVSYELIKDAAVRKDDQTLFSWLSRSSLTNPAARRAYLSAMADLTSRDGAVTKLVPVIGPAPSWSDTYWRAVIARKSSLANGARLRMEVAKLPWKQTEITDVDRLLVQQLVKVREFDLAQQLSGVLLRRPSVGDAILLDKGSFMHQPELPPFDWQLTSLGNLGASIEADNGSLVISAIAGAQGVAARRLLYIAPGDYSLSWTISGEEAMPTAAVSIAIVCAEAGGQDFNPKPIDLLDGVRKIRISTSRNTCRWAWLNIEVNIPDDSPGIDFRLRDLSFVRADA